MYNSAFFNRLVINSQKGECEIGPNKRWQENSKGSEVSGGPVRRDNHEVTYNDGSKHTTQSVTTKDSSGRFSWDTDSSGKDSNVHGNMND